MFHKRSKAGVRKVGAGIAGEFVKDLLASAFQQNISDHRGDLRSLRNRQQVPLGLGIGDVDQIAVGEAGRLRQYRRCYRNVVIPGETPYDVDGSVADRRQTLAQFRERSSLDPFDQMSQDVVEHADLLIVEAIGILYEKIGDAP